MESNLEKAKRQIKDNALIMGSNLPDDCFIFQMLELASIPDKADQKTVQLVFDWIQSDDCIIKSIKTGKQYLDATLDIDGIKLSDYVKDNYR